MRRARSNKEISRIIFLRSYIANPFLRLCVVLNSYSFHQFILILALYVYANILLLANDLCYRI